MRAISEHTFSPSLGCRLDLERATVLKHVADRNWQQLMLADQLLAQQQAGLTLANFNEGKITFAPTFKHWAGAKVENGRANRPYETKKMRVPSYCDRILWRSWPGTSKKLALLKYDAVTSCTSSDHTPVTAIFDLNIATPRAGGDAHELWLGSVDLVMYDIRAEALKPRDANGLADPYIRISSDFQLQPSSSSVKRKCLSPAWEGEELRLCVPHYRCWRSNIEDAHVFAEVLDEDKYSKDDLIGCCVLSCEVSIVVYHLMNRLCIPIMSSNLLHIPNCMF